jgi:C2 domain
MPSILKVRVKAARHLPVMDGGSGGGSSAATAATAAIRNAASGIGGVGGGGGGGGGSHHHHSSSLSLSGGISGIAGPSTDAYVRVTLGGHVNLTDQVDEAEGSAPEKQKRYSAKTRVCRRTLNPVWDEEIRFDVSNDTLLQDEPLIFQVCDSDALSADESIGRVYVDLNPLLTQTASTNDDDEEDRHHYLDGWFPLYDTLGGVRGELELSVKLNFIGDVNPFKESSAGVQLFPFSTLDPAAGFAVVHILGFTEELIVGRENILNLLVCVFAYDEDSNILLIVRLFVFYIRTSNR